MKREEEVIECFKKCVALDPGDIDKDFKGLIAEIYLSIGRLQEAIAFYK